MDEKPAYKAGEQKKVWWLDRLTASQIGIIIAAAIIIVKLAT